MPSPDARGSDRRWRRHPLAGFAVRAVIVVVPFLVAMATIIAVGRSLPRQHGTALLGWYAVVCGSSWAVLWVFQRWLARLLPLAVLLEMALVFPDRAPSRANLARRAGSNRELRMLLSGGEHGEHKDETVQQAAERVLALVGALARHDRKTRGHAERIRALTDLIAERMSLPRGHRDRLRWAALLHDIGKLHIPHELLNKAGTPTRDEWDLLKTHPEHGARIIEPLMDWLDGWGDVVVQHHERWDGTGYPRGLSGTEITLGARIVAVADAYDVMTSNRAYKKPIGRAAALRELADCSGSQFDPTVVRAMLEVPGRRLLVALGPLSWISGLPLVGQTGAVASGVASQAGAALGMAAVTGTAALTPVMPLGHDQNPTPLPRPSASATPTATATATATPGSYIGTQTATYVPAPAPTATTAKKAPATHHHHAATATASPKPTPSGTRSAATKSAPVTASTPPHPAPGGRGAKP